MSDIEQESKPAAYTLGAPVVDELEATAVIEVFRNKDDESICVAAVIMVQGTVACPVIEDWTFEGPEEKQLFTEIMIDATGRMADFYSSLPKELRERLETEQGV